MAVTEPSPCAARARRYRRRRRAGIVLVPVAVNSEALSALLEYGLLASTADAGNRAKVSEAIELLLFALTNRAIKIDNDGLS